MQKIIKYALINEKLSIVQNMQILNICPHKTNFYTTK